MKSNIKSFKKLIKRYRSITMEEIDKANLDARKLTGYGHTDSCSLCEEAREVTISGDFCEYCIYKIKTGRMCCGGINEKTYEAIHEALSPEDMLEAYRIRADYMESLIK